MRYIWQPDYDSPIPFWEQMNFDNEEEWEHYYEEFEIKDPKTGKYIKEWDYYGMSEDDL